MVTPKKGGKATSFRPKGKESFSLSRLVEDGLKVAKGGTGALFVRTGQHLFLHILGKQTRGADSALIRYLGTNLGLTPRLNWTSIYMYTLKEKVW